MTLNDTKYQKNTNHFDKIGSHDFALNFSSSQTLLYNAAWVKRSNMLRLQNGIQNRMTETYSLVVILDVFLGGCREFCCRRPNIKFGSQQ